MKRSAVLLDENILPVDSSPSKQDSWLSQEDVPSSPTKRTRSHSPPRMFGPLTIGSHGQLLQSSLFRSSSDIPGVFRLNPPQAAVTLLANGAVMQTDLRMLLSAVDNKLVLVFDLNTNRAVDMFLKIQKLQKFGLWVSHEEASVPAIPAPRIVDPLGALARECRVLDPIGGGRAAAECIVIVVNGEVRNTMLLGRSYEDIEATLNIWL